MRSVVPMIEYSHCDSYYVNKTKFTYWSVRDGLTDTLLVNVLAFLVSFTLPVTTSNRLSVCKNVKNLRQ